MLVVENSSHKHFCSKKLAERLEKHSTNFQIAENLRSCRFNEEEGNNRDSQIHSGRLASEMTRLDTLENLSGLGLNPAAVNRVVDNVEEPRSFDESSFDLVISANVLMHIKDVENAANNMRRVLKQMALSPHIIHLFPSIIGNKNSESCDLTHFPPWYHLRDNEAQRRVFVNRLRLKNHMACLTKYLSKIWYHFINLTSRRGVRSLLSEDVLGQTRLDYPDIQEELLREKMIVIGER
jgi:SAM-dependent methyltransferase